MSAVPASPPNDDAAAAGALVMACAKAANEAEGYADVPENIAGSVPVAQAVLRAFIAHLRGHIRVGQLFRSAASIDAYLAQLDAEVAAFAPPPVDGAAK